MQEEEAGDYSHFFPSASSMRAIALLLCTAATSPPASYGFTPSLLGGFVGSSYRSPSITAAAAAASTEAEATPAADSSTDCASDKPQLYDLPVSNNGARVRMCIYYKELEEDVDIVSPMDLGGLQSPEYKAVNPQGKMPAMAVGDLNFGESDTIVRYLLDRFVDKGPSLLGASLEERLLANAVARHHDMYIGPIQGCMYKAFPPFGVFGGRREALNELLKQLQVLEDMVAPKATDTGPFLAGGTEPTLADCTVFPTALFIEYMLPKFGFSADEFFGPTVGAWFYGAMGEGNPVAQRVRGEIVGALEKWDARGRWDTIAGAGKRDTVGGSVGGWVGGLMVIRCCLFLFVVLLQRSTLLKILTVN